MERVQFQQEQMLAELKDLEEKGFFTHAEIKSILKRRTAFESALIRRIPQKGDFLRYAAYEMGLEALRRRRVQRLKLPPGAPSISDYALVRRQFHIFERALRKFKADVGLWVQYIELAKREGARALVGRISARALQLHPNEPALYVFAAQHEVESQSPAAARTLLQRGLRLNGESVRLWGEYVKFELGFVEGLRRRWDVLGVEQGEAEAGDGDGEEARREIMEGGIVKAVISEAGKAIPRLDLFEALHALLSSYPSPLRAGLLEHLHALLLETLPDEPGAVKLHATRFLAEEGDDFVDRLRAANEELAEKARTHEGASAVYAEFVEEWCTREIDPNLWLYLVSSLQSVAAGKVAPRALATHLRLLISARHPSPPGLDKVVKRARKYTGRASSGELWIARLEVEVRARGGVDEEVRRTWAEARKQVEAEDVWLWGVRDAADCEVLLRESMSLRGVHTRVLIEYQRLGGQMERIVKTYLPNEEFFRAVFRDRPGEEVYREWRRVDAVGASVAWAEWLLGQGDGARAAEVVKGVKGAEEEWRRVLEGDGGQRVVEAMPGNVDDTGVYRE